jgi:hypothetical protein
VLKTKLALGASLRDVLGMTIRGTALEFQQRCWGARTVSPKPRRAAAPRDIRHWLLRTPAQLALVGPAGADGFLII